MDKEEKSQLSPEALSEKIVSIVNRIKTDSDSNPVELEEIKKIIRKNVPFFMRGAFSAYILRELLNSSNGRNGNKPQRERKDRRESKFQSVPMEKASKPQVKKNDAPKKPVEPKAAPAAVNAEEKPANAEAPVRKEEKEERVIPEGAKTLYLNVGKMKRLYAKNLSMLLQTELEITREDIYSLRVHDKYSFITMSEENCEKAIEKLNGKDINGRTAMLSYSNR